MLLDRSITLLGGGAGTWLVGGGGRGAGLIVGSFLFSPLYLNVTNSNMHSVSPHSTRIPEKSSTIISASSPSSLFKSVMTLVL